MKDYIWNNNDVCVNPDVAYELQFGKNQFDRCRVTMAKHNGNWYYGIEYPNGCFAPHLHPNKDQFGPDYNNILEHGKACLRRRVQGQLEWLETNAKIHNANDAEGGETHAIAMYRYFCDELDMPTLF